MTSYSKTGFKFETMFRKQYVDTEGRQFNERLNQEYMFVLNGDKPV